MTGIVERAHFEKVWDKLAAGEFRAANLRKVDVDGLWFHVLFLPREEEFTPGACFETGLSFCAWPRLAGYRYRFVLVPSDTLAGIPRWQVRPQDVADWIRWSGHMEHVVTFSTFKSGASEPFCLHAQSFPLNGENGRLSALPDAADAETVVRFGCMPHFDEVQIDVLRGYPVRGVRITSRRTQTGQMQAARKACELALNYDGLKAFNLVIVPREDETPAVYLFPRRKDGKATYGLRRWQIAALEINGLMQVTDSAEAEQLDSDAIRDIFSETTLNEEQFREFCIGIESF